MSLKNSAGRFFNSTFSSGLGLLPLESDYALIETTGQADSIAIASGYAEGIHIVDGTAIAGATATGAAKLLYFTDGTATADSSASGDAISSVLEFTDGLAEADSSAIASALLIQVYESDGGEIVLSSLTESESTFFFEQEIQWQTTTLLEIEKDFNWNVGDQFSKWYRVQGCCQYSTEAAKGGCDIISLQTEDPLCVGNSGKQQFIQNYLANSLSDLCNQLQESGLRWEICSIQQFSKPADPRLANPDECNILTPVPFCEIPECIDFCLKTTAIVKIKAKAYIENIYIYESDGGLINLTSISDITISEDVSSFYESTGGEIILSSISEFDSSWNDDFTVKIRASASVDLEEIIYAETEITSTIPFLFTSVVTSCGLCRNMPLTLNLNHNLSKSGELIDFLQRNGAVLPDSITLHYNSRLRSWLGNYHLSGIGDDNNNSQESWRFSFSWSCSDDGSPQWKFSMLISRVNLIADIDVDTRLIILFPPDQICSISQNFSFNFSFDVNTSTRFVQNNFDLDLNDMVLFDNIGLFKSRNWVKSPILRIVLSKNPKIIDVPRIDISTIFPETLVGV